MEHNGKKELLKAGREGSDAERQCQDTSLCQLLESSFLLLKKITLRARYVSAALYGHLSATANEMERIGSGE